MTMLCRSTSPRGRRGFVVAIGAALAAVALVPPQAGAQQARSFTSTLSSTSRRIIPKSFSLSVTGSVSGGATVTAGLSKGRNAGLTVTRQDVNTGDIGPTRLVPLGFLRAGTRTVHWNLKVDGVPLSPGLYVVALALFDAKGRPTGYPPAPQVAKLAIDAGGADRVQVESLAPASEESGGTSVWVAVAAGVVGLALGAIAAWLLARRRRSA